MFLPKLTLSLGVLSVSFFAACKPRTFNSDAGTKDASGGFTAKVSQDQSGRVRASVLDANGNEQLPVGSQACFDKSTATKTEIFCGPQNADDGATNLIVGGGPLKTGAQLTATHQSRVASRSFLCDVDKGDANFKIMCKEREQIERFGKSAGSVETDNDVPIFECAYGDDGLSFALLERNEKFVVIKNGNNQIHEVQRASKSQRGEVSHFAIALASDEIKISSGEGKWSFESKRLGAGDCVSSGHNNGQMRALNAFTFKYSLHKKSFQNSNKTQSVDFFGSSLSRTTQGGTIRPISFYFAWTSGNNASIFAVQPGGVRAKESCGTLAASESAIQIDGCDFASKFYSLIK